MRIYLSIHLLIACMTFHLNASEKKRTPYINPYKQQIECPKLKRAIVKKSEQNRSPSSFQLANLLNEINNIDSFISPPEAMR